ncbi:MAG: hypothetical protein AAGF72_05485 [Pseudomonadota bacterium]
MQSATSIRHTPYAASRDSSSAVSQLVSSAFVWTCLLTTSGYALLSVPGYNFHLLLVGLIAFITLSLSLTAKLQVLAQPRIALTYLLILVGGALLATIASADAGNTSSFAKFFLSAVSAYMLTCYLNPQVFLKQFVYVMSGLAVISLLVYAAVNFLGVSLPLPTFVNANDMPYKAGFLFFVFDNHLTFRNTGPFWEPGIYGTYLALALLATAALDRHRLLFRVILTVTLVSTMSTASILFLAILAGMLLISGTNKTWQNAAWWNFGFVALVLLVLNLESVLGLLAETWPRIFSKFTAAQSISILERTTSPTINLQIFAESPFFGLGLNGAIIEYTRLTDVSQTSTVTFLLAAIGIVGGTYFVGVVHGVFRQSSFSLLARIALVALALSAINKEPHYYFTLTYVLLFYSVQTTFRKQSSPAK